MQAKLFKFTTILQISMTPFVQLYTVNKVSI